MYQKYYLFGFIHVKWFMHAFSFDLYSKPVETKGPLTQLNSHPLLQPMYRAAGFKRRFQNNRVVK
jgi:hypothetical protein